MYISHWETYLSGRLFCLSLFRKREKTELSKLEVRLYLLMTESNILNTLVTKFYLSITKLWWRQKCEFQSPGLLTTKFWSSIVRRLCKLRRLYGFSFGLGKHVVDVFVIIGCLQNTFKTICRKILVMSFYI